MGGSTGRATGSAYSAQLPALGFYSSTSATAPARKHHKILLFALYRVIQTTRPGALLEVGENFMDLVRSNNQ